MPAAVIGIRDAAIFVPAAWTRWWWWLVITTVITWTIFLRSNRSVRYEDASGGDKRSKGRKNYFFHQGYSISLLQEIEAHYARMMARTF